MTKFVLVNSGVKYKLALRELKRCKMTKLLIFQFVGTSLWNWSNRNTLCGQIV